MRLFPDDPKVYYQEVLRTVGAFIEGRGFRDIRIIESEDGLVVQGRAVQKGGEIASETYLLTVDDLHTMMREAYMKRGASGKTYEDRRIDR
jgi:hypothetical protein